MPQYDIFELFSDGSFRWRACVSGQYNKERKLQEFAETSANRFYAIDIAAGETLPPASFDISGPQNPVNIKAAVAGGGSVPVAIGPKTSHSLGPKIGAGKHGSGS